MQYDRDSKNDALSKSSVISMTGSRAIINKTGHKKFSKLFTPVTYSAETSIEEIRRDQHIGIIVLIQEKFYGYKGFLKQNPDKVDFIRNELKMLLTEAKIPRGKLDHTSISKKPLVEMILKELKSLD